MTLPRLPTSNAQRFPKWLIGECFEMAYEPGQRDRSICIRLFRKDNRYAFSEGFGSSVAMAAKEARKSREEIK